MASYPLPPWLSPSAAQGYGSLAGEGQRLNLERQKLQQEAVQASMEMQARQQEIAQRSAAQAQETARQYQLETQRAAIDKAYKESEIGLRQQQFDFDTQQASRRFAATQQALKAAQPIDKGGEGLTMQQSFLKYMSPYMTPDAASKMATARPPANLGATVPIPGRPDITAIQTGPNQIRVIPPAANTNAPTEVNFQGGKWEKNPSSGKYEMVRDRPKTAAEVDEELMQQAQARKGGGGSSALPLPKSKSDLKKGETYKTGRGDAEWDGEKFVLKAK